jgi:hypothetical protein
MKATEIEKIFKDSAVEMNNLIKDDSESFDFKRGLATAAAIIRNSTRLETKQINPGSLDVYYDVY